MRDLEIKVGSSLVETLPRQEAPPRTGWVGSSEKEKDRIDVFVGKGALNKALADGRTRGSEDEVGGTLVGRRFIDSVTGKPCTEGEKWGNAQRHSGYYLYEEDKTPFEINLTPLAPERDEAQEQLKLADYTLRVFLEEQPNYAEEIFPKVANHPVDEDLELIAQLVQKEISQLAVLANPTERQAAIEKAKRLKAVTAAYKLIRGQKHE